MHETSPGQVEKHELSIRSDNKSELNGAKTETIIDMEHTTVKNENIDDGDDSELNQRIYDDPCELMDGTPIFRLARSRSWFCCPSSEVNTTQSSTFYNRCPDFSLITEEPKTPLNSVGCYCA